MAGTRKACILMTEQIRRIEAANLQVFCRKVQ